MSDLNNQVETIALTVLSGDVLIDSRIVAERMGLDHNNLKENITKYKTELEAFGSLRFETAMTKFTRKDGTQGASTSTFYLLNKAQVTFLISRSRSTPQVIAFLTAYIKRSEELETTVQQQRALIGAYKHEAQALFARVQDLAAMGEELDTTVMRRVQELAKLNKQASVMMSAGRDASPKELLNAQQKAVANVRDAYITGLTKRVERWVDDYSTYGDYDDVAHQMLDANDFSESAVSEFKRKYATDLWFVQDCYVKANVGHDDEFAWQMSVKRLGQQKHTKHKPKQEPSTKPFAGIYKPEGDDWNF